MKQDKFAATIMIFESLSSNFQIVLTILIIAVCIYYFVKKTSDLDKIPGPYGLPFIGNTLQLDTKNPQIQCQDWARKYGSVFKLNLGGKDVVILGNYSSIHQALISEEFAGKPDAFRLKVATLNFSSTFWGDPNPKQRLVRKLVNQHFKIHSSGNQKGRDALTTILSATINEIKQSNGSPIKILPLMQSMVIKLSYAMVFDRHLDDSKEEQTIKDVVAGFSSIVSTGKAQYLFPFLLSIIC